MSVNNNIAIAAPTPPPTPTQVAIATPPSAAPVIYTQPPVPPAKVEPAPKPAAPAQATAPAPVPAVAPPTPPAPPKPPATAKNTPDIEVDYRYSGPEGNGKQKTLDNGATLFSGDKFVIDIKVNKPICVYLMHYDAADQVHDLMALSGQANCRQAGDRLALPAPAKHFKLDDKVGDEVIHTIVSSQPLSGVLAKYEQGVDALRLGSQRMAELVGKGVTIENDEPAKTSPGRVVACLAEAESCRETFVIHHKAR